jgi:peroxiredoxin
MHKMTKKYLFSLTIFALVALMLATGCRNSADEVNASVRVKISSNKGETVYLERVTLDGPLPLDSAKPDQQGEVLFRVHVDDFDFFMLNSKFGDRILFLVEKGENVEIFTKAETFGRDYSVGGSGGSSLILDLEKKRSSTMAKLDSLGKQWIREKYAEDNLAKKVLFDSLASDFISAHKNYLSNFVERYPESPALIIAMYQVIRQGEPFLTYEQDFSVFQKVSESLKQKYPENPHVRDFVRRTREYQEEQEAWQQREAQLQPGSTPPQVELFNIRGEKVALTDHIGKYVLIYFWDARNKESWETNARLAPLYQKFRYKGFEVIGIYTGSDKQLLYNAVRVDGLPWIHLFGNSVVEKQYNLKTIPAMLLIDREGKVLYRGTTVEELWQKLPWLLPGTGAARDSITITPDVEPQK